jgi:predicted nucleotidyltransferase
MKNNLEVSAKVYIFAADKKTVKMMLDVDSCKEKLAVFKNEHQTEYGIKAIGIFGSVARGDNDSDSDLDVFVELERPSFTTMFTLQKKLEELFGCKVDLVRKRDSLRPLFKRNLERDAVYA